MRSHGTLRTITLAFVAASIGMATDGARAQGERTAPMDLTQPRPVNVVESDPASGTTFSVGTDTGGNLVTSLKARDFFLDKAVDASGNTTIRLSQGKDAVTIAMSRSGYSVRRGKRTARLDPRAPEESDLDDIRSLLLGSPAVRTFRRLSASLENREQDVQSPLVLNALVDGALVQMLDGDPGATERLAKRITRRQRAALRPVAAMPMFRDCVSLYELSLLHSYETFESCIDTAEDDRWYRRPLWQVMCQWEFLLRSQQYIFQFSSCMAFPT